MSRFQYKKDRWAKHLNPDRLSFSMFTAEDVRKLCVVKITTPLTCDSLGHPYVGGLYDRSLGPMSDNSDPCKTCQKNVFTCAGHFGYIELPVCVVNPLFNKTISQIFRTACFKCFALQIKENVKQVLMLQMRLLNAGRLGEAVEMESCFGELAGEHGGFENVPDEKLAELLLSHDSTNEGDASDFNKNTEDLRLRFMQNFLAKLKPKGRCYACKAPIDRVTFVRGKFFMSVRDGGEGAVKAVQQKSVTPEDSRNYMRSIWLNERDILLQLVPVLSKIEGPHPTDIFYMEVLPVTPTNLRPVNFVNGRITEHRQTKHYQDILNCVMCMKTIMRVVKDGGDVDGLPDEARDVYATSRGTTPIEKFKNSWDLLQFYISGIVDASKYHKTEGLKQIIEKKQGIIRMHMMGKRVNFAARSVITPDPNLNIDEIGVPDTFAKRLTYPVPVTSWNVRELQKLIMNGPNVYPGAVMVEFENGQTIRINPDDPIQQKSILKRLLTPDGPDRDFRGIKKVYRHLHNGDVMLLNRQPTLHKPSIMAHTVRILRGEKTLRLHYANCKAYNADFDGDEMNAHFPQNELARSEAYTLANVSNQYLVPKDGTPLSGLIQDHVIAGVRMSVRGKFYGKSDYHQLVYQALGFKTSRITLLPPAILKPTPLWSGKQVLSTVLLNVIPADREPINLTSTAKVPAKAWERTAPRDWRAGGAPFKGANEMSEAEVVVRRGQLLVGVLDKTHYGSTPYSLVHCVYELYGGSYAVRLLSSFAKLFTWVLQREGFTLGVHDILVRADADRERSRIVRESRKIGDRTMRRALNVGDEDDIVERLEEQAAGNPKLRSIVDRQYKSALDSFTNEINKVCLPKGLICKFPDNNLQLMVQSGAKGSTVNTMQISCLLGQIELEGKRPPVMICGRSLPSFPLHEFAPRAGGFIDGRFMTGIQPQEFFFHCMAGREGLIDTAVKTSRSGYLQRCLIKHLEGLTVNYDLTVRDSDRSVVQFCYGEDGMDISKAQFLNGKQLPFLDENRRAIVDDAVIATLTDDEERQRAVRKYNRRVEGELKANVVKPSSAFTMFSRSRTADKGELVEEWRQMDEHEKRGFAKMRGRRSEPTVSKYPAHCNFGAINEQLVKLVDDYCDSKGADKGTRKGVRRMIGQKAMESLCAPGEPVGLLAAQSVGEPSTQMTLNTFHFAGRGDMNVTLGIPRLREILMVASKNIKTPSMEVPFLPDVPAVEKKAERLRRLLNRVVVADVLEKIDVTQELEITGAGRSNKIALKFHFIPYRLYKNDYHLRPERIVRYMGSKFFKTMFAVLRKHAEIKTSTVSVRDKEGRRGKAGEDEDDEGGDVEGEGAMDDDEGSEDEVEDPDDAKTTSKKDADDQEPEGEEVEKEEEDNEEEEENDTTMTQQDVEAVRSAVVETHDYVKNYAFDAKDFAWCELTFAVPVSFKRVDMTAVLREAAAKAVLWETPGIRRAFVYKQDDGRLLLKTDGINLNEIVKYSTLLDINRLYANDIHKIAETYGVEAAAKVVVREVRDVFKVYGITVDPRHLLLIADYMTYTGSFLPLSRTGMASSASPLQQMSFESSLTFLKAATIGGKTDKLENPSSCLMVGKPCSTGTGTFTLIQKLQASQSIR